MPKVSIIMPTHNRAWIIRMAIDSVLAQTFTDFELIVIDDDSTDETQESLASYKDKRIVVTKSTKHSAPGARNVGLKLAKGDIVAYLDSDNRWHPQFLEVMVDTLEDSSSPSVMAYSAQNLFFAVRDKDDKISILARQTRTIDYNPAKLLEGNFVDINSVVHLKSLLEEVGLFDETLPALEDWELFCRIALKHPFGIQYVDSVLSDYYFYSAKSSDTVTNKFYAKHIAKSFGLLPPDAATKKAQAKITRYRKQFYL